MSESIKLSYIWDHTIKIILNYDLKYKMGNMIKEWFIFNKLEDFNSLLKYTDDDFTLIGKLCYINENGEMLPTTTLQEFYNLRWYIQHLIDENEYQYGDHEWTNPLSESNWIYKTNKHFMKYLKFTLQEMTPEQIKQNAITLHLNQKLDTEEGESTKVQEEFTTSEELTEEYSTFSDMSKQDSGSDINIDDTQDQENSQTPETLQINTTMHDKDNSKHDEYDTSQHETTTKFETYEHYGEDLSSYELKWTIDAILQHMGFHPTTENPCVMMRVNHITKSCEYIIIYHDELYIALTTFEQIIHIVNDKYKIKINPHVYQGSNFPCDPGGTIIC